MDDDTPDEFRPEQVKLSTPASSTKRPRIPKGKTLLLRSPKRKAT